MDALHAGDAGNLSPMRRFIHRAVIDVSVIAAYNELFVPKGSKFVSDYLARVLTRNEIRLVTDLPWRCRLSDRGHERAMKQFTNHLRSLLREAKREIERRGS